jgi:hypothetical protein
MIQKANKEAIFLIFLKSRKDDILLLWNTASLNILD